MISDKEQFLPNLPLDILALLLDKLDPPDLASFCRTCQPFYKIAISHLYKRLIVTDSPRSSCLARRAAVKHGTLIRTLRLEIRFQGCADLTCSLCLHQYSPKSRDHVCWAVANPGGGLPPAVKELLEGLQGLLPFLEGVEVALPAKVNHVTTVSVDVYDELCPRSMLRRENMCIVTRAAMKALARNKTITKLRLTNYTPFCPYGSDETDRFAWERLLGRITEFDLSLFGEQGSDSFNYRKFVRGMDSFFLNHLKSAKQLRISASVHVASDETNLGDSDSDRVILCEAAIVVVKADL